MIIDLSDTDASEIAGSLIKARRNAGSPAMGMVLTLIVVADESSHYDALKAAMQAAKEHPSRIIGVIPRGGRGSARLDAEVRVGGEAGPGESLLLRLYGELSRHAESVVMPLLLPESPVVTWWPGKSPENPAGDPLGQLARRRVTDAASARRPLDALTERCGSYAPGDTDLSWTRITPWRALLAAALDQRHGRVDGATVHAERSNASADLLAAWLSKELHVKVEVRTSRGPGITAARLHTVEGDIAITRPDGLLARYSIPNQPERHVALKRRETSELLAEELRRLDPDDIYAVTVEELLRLTEAKDAEGSKNGTRRAGSTSSSSGSGRSSDSAKAEKSETGKRGKVSTSSSQASKSSSQASKSGSQAGKSGSAAGAAKKSAAAKGRTSAAAPRRRAATKKANR